MEILDVLNEKGEKTGLTKPKKQVHIDGDWHRAVHVWFINLKGELLLQRRGKNVTNHPNEWDISAAGHVSAGEDSETSALREIEEEIGVRLKNSDLKYLGSVTQQAVANKGTYINNEHNDVYLVKMEIDTNKLNLQDEEVDEVRLIPWREFQEWVQDKKEDLVSHPTEYKLLFKYLEEHYEKIRKVVR